MKQVIAFHVHLQAAHRSVPRPLHHLADRHAALAARGHVARACAVRSEAAWVEPNLLTVVFD